MLVVTAVAMVVGQSAMVVQVAASDSVPVYYIAAEEIQWDYAPSGGSLITGQPFTEGQQVFTEQTGRTLGRVYIKAVDRAYTDAGFNQPVVRTRNWEHLGLLGPVIRAQVGETITVVFLNKASRPYSMHPHGVFYDKSSEGAGYADNTEPGEQRNDAVSPGQTHTYT